jgi:hypothetical protein
VLVSLRPDHFATLTMSFKKIYIVSAALVTIAAGCSTKSAGVESPAAVTQSDTPALLVSVPEVLKANCYLCHNPAAPSHDAIIAPPLAVAKLRYNRQYQTKDEFVDSMTAFLINPTKEKAIMYGAVDRFGVMPRSTVDEKTLREIVEYIYNNKLEEPSWLKEEMGSRGMQ